MIKQGQLVALDKMSNLLAGTASTMLRFKTDQTLPDDLSAQARVTGRVVQLPARDAADVEAILGRLRQSGLSGWKILKWGESGSGRHLPQHHAWPETDREVQA